jgi:hypothetical protein
MTTGHLASSATQQRAITGANLNRTTARVAVTGRGGNVESPNTMSHVAAARGGRGGMNTGPSAYASQRRTVTSAYLSRTTTAPAVAGQGGDGSQVVQRNQIAVGRGGHGGGRTAGQSLVPASQVDNPLRLT